MKDLQEDDIFGSVRERMGRYEEAPSEGLWEKIAARKGERVVAPAWALWAGGVSLGLAVLMLFLVDAEEEVITVQKKSAAQAAVILPRKQERIQPEGDFVAPSNSPIIPSTTPSPIIVDKGDEVAESNSDSDSIIVISPIILPKDSSITETLPPYKKPKGKFQLYFSITPSLSFQKIIPNNNDQIIIEGFEHRSPLSIKRFGFGLDAGFQRDINHIFGYYGGISFYHQQQSLTYRYFDSQADVNRVGDSWTFEINRPQHIRTFDYTMTNLGLRSGILVTLKGEKLKHKFGGGLIFSQGFLKGTDSYNNSQSRYLSYQVFYRNEVKINERLSWFIEPTFIYSFLSKEKLAEPFKLKPYRAGISAGVLYRF